MENIFTKNYYHDPDQDSIEKMRLEFDPLASRGKSDFVDESSKEETNVLKSISFLI